MNGEYIKGYREGYINALDIEQNMKYQMFGMDLGKVLEIVSNHTEEQEKVKMNGNLKYEWCKNDAKSDKEFLGWIYQRLHSVYNELSAQTHMRRLEGIIDSMVGAMPTGPKKTIDITDNNSVIIKRHGKTVYEE